MRSDMTLHETNQEKPISLPENYKTLHPIELLHLFKKLAPYSLSQHEAQIVYRQLTTYLTDEEEKRIFESWEHMHYDPGEFYSVIHDLLFKYSVN